MAPKSGSLSPRTTTISILQTGTHHLSESPLSALLQNIYGALLLSAGCTFSIIVGGGISSAIKSSNPGIQRLVQGAAFPLGLVLVYLVGAELFTGYPMWFALTSLQRQGRVGQYAKAALVSWVGNLIGAVVFTLWVNVTDSFEMSVFRETLVEQVTSDIVKQQWHVVFLRAIGCGWLVTLAMFLGEQNQDGLSRFLGLHFPFMVATTIRLPHVVEYMFLCTAGMSFGADLSVGGLFWKALLPVTLGNVIGGGLLTGGYLWWIYLQGESEGQLRLDEDD